MTENQRTNARCFRYARVSTFTQANEGLSVDFQKEEMRRFYAGRLENKYHDGGEFVDTASAFKKMLMERPAGKELHEQLQPGDAIIVYRLDRTFRSLKDLVRMTEMWMGMNVNVYFISEGFELQNQNIVSRLLMQILCAVAEFESGLTGQRIRDGFVAMKARGQPINNTQPPLLEWKYNGTYFTLHKHDLEIEIAKLFWELRNEQRMPYQKLIRYCFRHKIKRPAKQPCHKKNRKKGVVSAWNRNGIQDMVEIWRRVLYLESQGVDVWSREFLNATARGQTILTLWGPTPDGDAMLGADQCYVNGRGRRVYYGRENRK